VIGVPTVTVDGVVVAVIARCDIFNMAAQAGVTRCGEGSLDLPV